MNILLIIALVYMAINAFIGYRRGLLHIILTVVLWIVIMVVGVMVTPSFAQYLTENTQIDEHIQEECTDRLMESIVASAKEQIAGQIDSALRGEEDGKKDEEENGDMFMPEPVLEDLNIGDQLAEAAVGSVTDSDMYKEVGSEITRLAMNGIALLILLVAEGILYLLILHAIKDVNEVPVLGKANKVAGCVIGIIKSVCVIWIFMAAISMNITGGYTQYLSSYIEESAVLSILYEHNPILMLLLKVL